MKLENQVVSLEIAKRLKELGVKQESYFYWKQYIWSKTLSGKKRFTLKINPNEKNFWGSNHVDKNSVKSDYSAFTVAELGERLPNGIEDRRGAFIGFLSMLSREDSNIEGEKWGIAYVHNTQDSGEVISIFKGKDVAEYADTEADARGKMLIYLLENKLITL